MDTSLPPILPPGTQVVLGTDARPRGGGDPLPAGTVARVVAAPADPEHSYLVRTADGREAAVRRGQVRVLSHEGRAPDPLADFGLYAHDVVLRAVVGSRAYGLDHGGSDTDVRGVYLAPAARFFSLAGVPEQIENQATEECYWELGKFLRLALKANPNVLECLWTPLARATAPEGAELLAMREAFSSKLVYQTFGGYALSQLGKIERDLKNHDRVKWKHAMHLVRLLLSGIGLLRTGTLEVRVTEHRDRLLAIRDGSTPWEEVDAWRKELHREFEAAFAATRLPDRPDFDRADEFLVRTRAATVERAAP